MRRWRDDWQITERFWTTSDHKAISFRTSTETAGPWEWKVVDWKGVKAAVEDKDWTPEEREAWWKTIPEETAYDKLVSWLSHCVTTQVVTG